MRKRTLPELLEESVRSFASNPFLMEKSQGAYHSLSYQEVHQEVLRLASGLLSLGLQPGERVALISEGRNRWVISEFAIFYVRGISVPLSTKLQESDLAFRLHHSGCRMAILSAGQIPKLRKAYQHLPGLQKVILLDPGISYPEKEISYEEVDRMGSEDLRQKPEVVRLSRDALRESDPACICYTSGTTNDPKGIVLTHLNFVANVEQCFSVLEVKPTYSSLLLLPWDHSFTHTAGIYLIARKGASLAAVETGRNPTETLRNLPKNIQEIRPSFLFSVPALAQSFIHNIERAVRAKGKITATLFHWGKRIAYAYNLEGHNRGRGWRKLLRPLYAICDQLIFKKIRQSFGGQLLFFIGGGALLDMEPQRFFYAIGIPMFQGYGLTEASPVISANSPERHKLGSSGFPVVPMEIAIRDEQGNVLPPETEGEITIRGENVMAGYWQNESATREAIRGDGWLHTGDRGHLDKDGFLYVLGRFKSLLINRNGEKYSPEGIEQAITNHCPLVMQIMLHNDHYPHTIAFLVPNRSEMLSHFMERNLSPKDPDAPETALQLLQAEINTFRKGGRYSEMFPNEWLPAAIAIIAEPFSEQNRMINSTLKMVRGTIIEQYRQRLELLVTPEGRHIVNDANRAAMTALLRNGGEQP